MLKMFCWFAVSLALGATTPAQSSSAQSPSGQSPSGQSPQAGFDGKSWWEDVKVLADDKLEGRETGSPGLRRAQEYVVDQLKSLGVKPAGSKGYYQPIQFVVREISEKDSSLALVRDGKTVPLTLGEEAYFNSRLKLAPECEAPLVFIGYGLNIPEKSYNDLDGLELKGKIAVIVSGSPLSIPGALASHYQTAAERWKTLKAAGVVGVVTIPNPAFMDVPWSRISLNRTHPSMELKGEEFNETEGEQTSIVFNPAHAEMLFTGTGHSFEEIAALAKERKPLPRFSLPLAIRARTKLVEHQVESDNVVAKLEGADPALNRQYVVLSAHIDHIGIGEPINGDRIYNGAMDNGSGSALLLDLARSFHKSPVPLKRSILFVWVTAEEKGLLGSKYFAAHPTVEAGSLAADINTDMFLPIVPLKILTIYGLNESSLGDDVRTTAESLGVRIQDDPEPVRNLFIRSDQYNFIRHGVPSLAMKVGADPGTPEQAIFKEWLTKRYHAPSDDVDQPVDLASAAKFEEIVRALTITIANEAARPAWKADSFFRRYAQGN
jgi:Zn-dependent M28 family amino/carboxypeptidase